MYKTSFMVEYKVATFEYLWTPTKIGFYAIHAYVDESDEILEWDENNNEFENKVVEVVKRLPDLQIDSLTFSPVSEEGYSKVGINSELIAIITNHGVQEKELIQKTFSQKEGKDVIIKVAKTKEEITEKHYLLLKG